MPRECDGVRTDTSRDEGLCLERVAVTKLHLMFPCGHLALLIHLSDRLYFFARSSVCSFPNSHALFWEELDYKMLRSGKEMM